MNQFLEDFDDHELRDFFLGQREEAPPLICCRCGKTIQEGPSHPIITLTNRGSKLDFHATCFEDLFDRLERWSRR